MKYGLALAGAVSLLAAACGDAGTGTGGGGSGAGTTSATGSGGSGGSEGPAIDPALYDCSAKKPPVRVNTMPVACATDRSCAEKLVSGHRAAGGALGVLAPENTLSAVRAAVVAGVDFVETDPRETKDGVLVNMHDPEVDRTTLGSGQVDELTLAEVQALELKSSAFPGDYACERVPTLKEVLAEAKGKVHVLVDANKTSRVDLLVGAIQETGTLEWAIFDTDQLGKIDEALALEPSLLTMVRVGSTEELTAALDHFVDHPPVIIEINEGASPLVLVPLIHDAEHRALADVFVQDVAATLDEDSHAYDQAIANGIDIFQSDRPELVLQALGRWPPPPQP